MNRLAANAQDQPVAAVDSSCEKPPTATRLGWILSLSDCGFTHQDAVSWAGFTPMVEELAGIGLPGTVRQ